MTNCHVVKVGGSLLDWPELPNRLAGWLESATQARQLQHFVILAGGGRLVAELRELDARYRLGEEFCHWQAIDLLSTTTATIAQVIPPCTLVHALADLRHRLERPGRSCFAVADWLRHEEPGQPGHPLAISWKVTSDSIAARLAEVLGASRLTLLKSTSTGSGAQEFPMLSALGVVDKEFTKHAAALPAVRLVNLRAFGAGNRCKSPC